MHETCFSSITGKTFMIFISAECYFLKALQRSWEVCVNDQRCRVYAQDFWQLQFHNEDVHCPFMLYWFNKSLASPPYCSAVMKSGSVTMCLSSLAQYNQDVFCNCTLSIKQCIDSWVNQQAFYTLIKNNQSITNKPTNQL